MIPNELKRCWLYFDSSFPAPSESFLSRIVAFQDRVRMKNLAALAIQAITPRFEELLLYFLHTKIRWLWHYMNPNRTEWTLKKVQQRFHHSKRKPPILVLLSMLDFKTTISPLEMDGRKIYTRISSVKRDGGGGGWTWSYSFMINLYMSQVKPSRKV